ncbi:PREDICTED: uncharacterized protein LOC104824894 [Tarenaya hassleriana]|nr:PREDICTED: uncharacterized protein LOC104824894 [Tarenaya hassleriana]
MLTSRPLLYPNFPVLVTSSSPSFGCKSWHFPRCKSPTSFRLHAQNGGNDLGNGLGGKDEVRGGNEPISNGNGSRKEGWLGFNLRWGDLLNPDPDNFVAIGLAGVLTWASVQVLSQLLFISLAILVAALKYSFIAALLIFILITLL